MHVHIVFGSTKGVLDTQFEEKKVYLVFVRSMNIKWNIA